MSQPDALMDDARRCARTVLWRALSQPGLDYCALWRAADGWLLEGMALVALEGQPVQVRYAVTCADSWETRGVEIALLAGGEERWLHLVADEHRRWQADGRELPALRGCVDVDLGITPATNTLPIRRLDIPIGAGEDVTAAWVRFPELTIEPLPQRYTHLDATTYRYESRGGAFVADLTVDDLGLVVEYPGGWSRVAAGEGPLP